MRGNRKIDLNLVNNHFGKEKSVKFLSVNSEVISRIYSLCKKLSIEINKNYMHEDGLHSNFSRFRKEIFVFFTSIDDYRILLDKRLNNILDVLVEFKGYEDLFNNYCKPIAMEFKNLQENYRDENFVKNEIKEKLFDKLFEDTYVITRFSTDSDYIKMGSSITPICTSAEFVRKSHYAKNLIFIGTPSQFDTRFSTLFLAENTYFISYDFFENRITKGFQFNTLSEDSTISTLYDGISIEDGYKGELFEIEVGKIATGVNKDIIIQQYLNQNPEIKLLEQQECKLVVLKNNSYIFVPISSRLRQIEKEQNNISLTNLNQTQKGDYLLFRNHSDSELISDVADEILGDDALKYRAYQKKWKEKLSTWIGKYGIHNLSHHFRKKGIKGANEINLKNWVSPETICPDDFKKLLQELRFVDSFVEKILDASNEIKSAHLKAGRKISKLLLEEVNSDLLQEVEEKGYVKFGSKNFGGASFNIETVVEVYEQTFVVNRKDVLKVRRET